MQASEKHSPYLYGLDPVIQTDCKILIVGSFPSSISLARGEYYANPRNDFWKIIEVIFHLNPGLEYQDRINFLLSHAIGLWDVVSKCKRPGSADIAIREPEPARIGDMLIRYPEIHTILCNGRRAEQGLPAALQKRTGTGSISPVLIRYLPSSSPANAIRFAEKCASWIVLRRLLEGGPQDGVPEIP
jgi:TDG/mug DNA glycosylase family protein